MLKVSKLADYGIVVLAALGETGVRMTAQELAQATRLPEPTVAKVLKLLAKGKIVASARGVNGGYRLTAETKTLPVSRIIAAIDGPIAITACVEAEASGCSYAGGCSMRGRWTAVNAAITQALDQVTLADMTKGPNA